MEAGKLITDGCTRSGMDSTETSNYYNGLDITTSCDTVIIIYGEANIVDQILDQNYSEEL